MTIRFPLFLATLAFLFVATPASAAIIRKSEITLWENSVVRVSKDVFGIRGAIIGSLAYGDMGKDGVDEVVAGAGQGMEPLVTVHRVDGSRIFRFYAFDKKLRQGVNVAIGDVDGDNVQEIVTAPAFGAEPVIKLFNNYGKAKLKSVNANPIKHEFKAFTDGRLSGLSIAVADVDGDGKDEIIGAEGPLGGGEVRVFAGDGTLLHSFHPFDTVVGLHGINVAAGDLDGDGKAEIITAEASQGSHVSVWNISDLLTAKASWKAYHSEFLGGVRVAVGDDAGKRVVIASVAGAGAPIVKTFTSTGEVVTLRTVYESTFDGGVIAASGRGLKGISYMLTAPTSPMYYPGKTVDKFAEVDLTEQRMYAWERDYLMRTYLVSSGLSKTPTPIGDFTVLAKPLLVNYTRIYGPNDPRNYSFPNTRYNLMFKKSYYIHTAWWHDNFGNPMSHGCVNTNVADAEWMYNWAPVGMPVRIAKSLAKPVENSVVAEN